MEGNEHTTEPVTIRSSADFKRALDLRTGIVITIRQRAAREPPVETSDEHGKEVLATLQALLHQDREQEAAAKDEVESAEMPENVSPIDAMRAKPSRNT